MSIVVEDQGQAAATDVDRLDPSSFGALYERHRLAVYRYLRGRTQNEADALDLAADTFERAYAGLAGFRRRSGGVEAWLFRIARNVAIDAHRRRRSTVGIAGAEAHLGQVAVEAARVAGNRADILDLVARLPDDQRDAVLLRYAGGLTAREISSVVGTSEDAVQKRIERGLGALRRAVDDHA